MKYEPRGEGIYPRWAAQQPLLHPDMSDRSSYLHWGCFAAQRG